MSWYHRLTNLLRSKRLSRELDREIEFHVAERTDELVRGGMSAREARREAERRFGNQGVHKDAVRDVDLARWIESFALDLRFAVRNIRSRPLLSATVVATLALGVGISTGIFTVVDVMALRARVDGDRRTFVRIMSAYGTDSTPPGWPGPTITPDYLAYRDGARSLRLLAGWSDVAGTLDASAARVNGLLVTCEFFAVYALERPLMGRLLRPDDCHERSPVVVIGEDLWRHELGARSDVIGRQIRYHGRPVVVIGVAPAGFSGQLDQAAIWIPYSIRQYLGFGPDEASPTDPLALNLDGRLNAGYSRDDVRTELGLLAARRDSLTPGRHRTTVVTNGSLLEKPGNTVVVAALVGLILVALTCLTLVACANVVALLLARASARQREMAVRIALGSGPTRLLRMLLTETGLLAIVAGALGALLAARIPPFVLVWLTNRPVTVPVGADWTVFAYLTGLTLAVGAAAGLAPARASIAPDLVGALKGHGPGGRGGSRLGRLLIGAQIGAALMLLVGAAVLVRIPASVAATPRRYETKQLMMPNLRVAEPPGGGESWARYHAEAAEVLREIAGVETVAFGSSAPFDDERAGSVRVTAEGGASREIAVIGVSPEYFAAFGIPLETGRGLVTADAGCDVSPCPVVLSRQAARELWPGADAIGRRFSIDRTTSYQVVGIAGDAVRGTAVSSDAAAMYQAWSPARYAYHAFVRFRGDPAPVSRAMVAALRARFSDALVAPETVQSAIDWETATYRRLGLIVGVVAIVAAGLALVGVYGVVSLAARRRTKEVGIRLALGARKVDIHRALLLGNARPVAAGLVVGIAVTAIVAAVVDHLASRSIPAALLDPIAFAGSALALCAIALAAMFLPARRAANADPLHALREE